MSEITLQLPDALADELLRVSHEANQAMDQLAIELLNRAIAGRKFRLLRRQALEELGDHAPASDEQAFDLIR